MRIILLFTGAILLISFYINNQSAAKNNNNILLGVTMPFEGIKNKKVLKIILDYKNENIKFTTLSFVVLLPILFMSYISFQFLYLFLWVLVIIYGSNRVFLKYNYKLKELKRKNNWFISKKYLLTIDTEVSRMKDKMPISWLWFIPSIIISIMPIGFSLINRKILGTPDIVISLTSIITTVIFIILHRIYSKKSTEVFSEDSKVNLACNTIYKRTWTLGFIIAATIQSISYLLIFLLTILGEINILLFSLVVIIPVLIILLGVYFINDKIRVEKNRLIRTSENPIYVDNDEYWKNGEYNNPNDYRTMVEKRVGYGMTYNMATKKGKIMTYGSYVFGILISVILIFMFFIFDFSKITLTINNNLVKISAPIYGTTFNIEDIQDITKVDNINKGIKTNGIGTDRYSLGHYNIDDYGNSLLYIYSKNPPYIVIKLKDKNLFINGKSKDETEIYYNDLINKWKH
ncbi:PH domain-containing protein [Clostridium chauvoei]|uniref:Bacterial Pleckstrin homology domain-containing protein n=3 Tax=Clostridium chauvoei TaxID=46867 RepID=S6F1H5_9CLOT|nr:PH domain-containing protein [Clostridium chauvoei]ATD55709.1 hypothetical protein BTM20_10890 [Clostridium chauvoei]ATD56614.1 hypothetical protein BTM21_02130 [Clostridium chauvoei]MBX7280253.1 hypothetical protein [Clostridium chauvoei]MBX7282738.1 hypothetical protein [Clostridium chauvoei]MBX7285144.1 hypothetical protein [Clostridium chauvoei]